MGNGLAPPATGRRRVERYTFVGTALIALAFVGPALATLLGAGTPFDYGRAIATTLGALVVLTLVAWAVTRTRSDLAKAKARAGVGMVLCMTVATHIVTTAKEGALASEFVGDAVNFQMKHAAKFEDLAKRFDEVTVTQYVTAAALASTQGVSAGQAALERYRALLAQRNSLLQTYLAEYVAFLNTLPPGEARRGAESAIGPSKQATEELYKSLDRTQRAHADSIDAIFSWAQAHAGELGLRGQQLLFRTQKQQIEFAALVVRLRRAEQAVIGTVETAQVDGIRPAAHLERSMREAAMFMAK